MGWSTIANNDRFTKEGSAMYLIFTKLDLFEKKIKAAQVASLKEYPIFEDLDCNECNDDDDRFDHCLKHIKDKFIKEADDRLSLMSMEINALESNQVKTQCIPWFDSLARRRAGIAVEITDDTAEAGATTNTKKMRRQ